jgi:hypothetical protein
MGYTTLRPFDPSTEFILSIVEGLRTSSGQAWFRAQVTASGLRPTERRGKNGEQRMEDKVMEDGE